MSWLLPDAWVAACGDPAAGLSTPFIAQGGEDQFLDALAFDPRRLVFLIGEAGSGTSRVALEIARQAPLALYPDPLPPPLVRHCIAELQERLAAIPAHQRPVVVLDGPHRDEGFALAEALLYRPLHPRLLVLVPATAEEARRLLALTGGYPQPNALVATMGNAHLPARPMQTVPDEILPFALAGRRSIDPAPAGLGDLCERGLVARDAGSKTAICLLPDRVRQELVKTAIVESPAGPRRLAELLAGDPALRASAAAMLSRAMDGPSPSPIESVLFETPAPVFAATLAELQDRHAELPAPLLSRLSLRAEELLAGEVDPQSAVILALQVANHALAQGDVEGATQRLRAALAGNPPHASRARLLGALAEAALKADALAEAAVAYRALGDARSLARILRSLGGVHRLAGRFDEAAACADEIRAFGELDSADGLAASVLAMEVSADRGDLRGAITLAERVLAERCSIGDLRGHVLSLHRLADFRRRAGDFAGAEDALANALGLEQMVGNLRGETSCEYALGALAESRDDPAAATRHYTRAMKFAATAGMPTGALREALDRTRASLARRGTGSMDHDRQ